MDPIPTIEAEITILSPEEGGRKHLPDLNSSQYMPHLVVQSPDVRQAVTEGNRLVDDYLGVVYLRGASPAASGGPLRVTLGLMYHSRVSYDALRPGATFTIREGPKVVGYGRVVSCNAPA